MTETLTQGIISDCDQPGLTAAWGEWHPNTTLKFVTRRDGWHSLASAVYFIRGVRGVTLFKNYRNIEANEQAFDDNGWFNTGDIVPIDEAGYLYFSDRDKDMLKGC